MTKAKTPADLTITPRDRRFGRESRQERWWLGGDPFATAFMNALSVTFPKGEAFFIESVKAFRDGASPKLAGEIRAFVQQEVMHTREHVAFNNRVVDAGYDISRLEKRIDEVLELAKARPPIASLAATMALEHYTAILAAEILQNPLTMKDADPESAAMWRWHAIEEIEHKGVAFDTWRHATKDWSRWKRWKIKTLMMLVITFKFWRHRIEGALILLEQDGIKGWKARRGLAWYLVGKPGLLRKVFVPWLSYFMPGFHPWNHDDRALIGKAESDYAEARLAAA